MKKILFVEDDEFLGTIYSDILKSIHDVSVLLINDGKNAYNEILKTDWDLIILDALLPELSAVDILNQLKQFKPEKLKQNIIILTNLEDGKMMDELKQFQYKIFLKKSLNPDEFLTEIKNLLT
jgi:DNA-binding response OmpR family regulator